MFDRPDFLNNSVNIAKMILSYKVDLGSTVVDATMGNGNDTLFLSQLVGTSGKVYAFDVQQVALDNTRKLLLENDCHINTELICDGHQNIDNYIEGKIKLILFNLGYLPGTDRNCTTKYQTTITAIKKSLPLLDSHGLILLVIYAGHDKEKLEKEKIIEFASHLPQNEYNVFYTDMLNQPNNPPVLLGIEKRA